MNLIKIAVVGPESTGKSSLAESLAEYFGTIAVPEYAREYCKDLNREYTYQDEINMFYGQVALEKSLLSQAKNNLLICDTMFLTVKIWCDRLFGRTPEEIDEALQDKPYDFYLLMDIDLPWEDDPLRDFPNERQHFMEVWHRELTAIQANYTVISGMGEIRVQNAIQAIQQFLSKKNSFI